MVYYYTLSILCIYVYIYILGHYFPLEIFRAGLLLNSFELPCVVRVRLARRAAFVAWRLAVHPLRGSARKDRRLISLAEIGDAYFSLHRLSGGSGFARTRIITAILKRSFSRSHPKNKSDKLLGWLLA